MSEGHDNNPPPPNSDGIWNPDGEPTPDIPPAPPGAPEMLGPYKLLEILGEGTFGRVYLAERREPMVQRVAIKVIKPGMDTRAVLLRFEAERQALALMDHPNIARVFDAGATPEGRPYFVMEHVPGVPITVHCDRARLTIRQRLELFATICDAVAHAHMKGILHRDLKPTNILVSVREAGGGVPKIIDFGLAKAMQMRLTEHTVFTEQGVFVGTLEYISPEQAEMTAQDVDTRTDVYALGVLLYQLLTGALPFDSETLRLHGQDEMRRIIREEDPPRPSTRLTEHGRGAEVAEARRIPLNELADELRHELEWVPLKAMRKDRAERYRSAQELGDEVRRYLSGQALAAGPETARYRLRKFARRNRGKVLATAAVLMALTAGLVISLILLALLALSQSKVATQSQLARARSHEANLAAASAFLETGNATEAKTRLDRCEPSLRAWEWRRLRYRSGPSIVSRSVNDPINSVQFSSDDRGVCVLGTSRVIMLGDRLQDAPGGWTYREDGMQAHPLGSASAVTSDGAQILLSSDDAKSTPTLSILHPNGRSEALTLGRGSGSGLGSLALRPLLSADGRVSVSAFGSDDRCMLVVLAGSHRRELALARVPERIALAADGTAVAAAWIDGDGNCRCQAWELRGDEKEAVELQLPAGALGERVKDLAIASKGASAAASSVSSIIVWKRQVLTYSVMRIAGGGNRVAVSREGRWLAYAADSVVHVLDLSTSDSATLQGHESPVYSLAFDGRGRRLITATRDGDVSLWNVEPDDIVGPSRPLNSATSSTDGRLIAALDTAKHRGMVLFDTKDREFRLVPGTDVLVILAASLSLDGSRLALATDQAFCIIETVTGKVIHAATLDQLGVKRTELDRLEDSAGVHVAFSSDSPDQLVLALQHIDKEGEVLLLDLGKKQGRLLASFDLGHAGVLSQGSPLSFSSGMQVTMWKAGLEGSPTRIEGGLPPGFVAAEPSTGRLAAVGLKGNAWVVDPASGRCAVSQARHTQRGRVAAWMTGEHRIATGADDQKIIVWDDATLDQALIEPVGSPVVGLAYRADTQTLWALLGNGHARELRVWAGSTAPPVADGNAAHSAGASGGRAPDP